LNRRTLLKPDASATSAIGSDVSWINCLASKTRRVLRHRDRRRPDMLAKQPSQLGARDAQPVCETFDIGLIETAGFDQGERARHRVGGAAPEREIRRGFRPAPQTRAKPASWAAAAEG